MPFPGGDPGLRALPQNSTVRWVELDHGSEEEEEEEEVRGILIQPPPFWSPSFPPSFKSSFSPAVYCIESEKGKEEEEEVGVWHEYI